MNSKLRYYLYDVVRVNNYASDELIDFVQKQLDFVLPDDYIQFIKEFNGGEGEIGENSWLVLFPIEELILKNRNYHLLMEQIPSYFLFGKDSADTGYSFHKQNHTYHSFGLMSNFKTDFIDFCGNNFEEFVEHLYNI